MNGASAGRASSAVIRAANAGMPLGAILTDVVGYSPDELRRIESERGRDLLRRFERTVYQHDRCARAVEERFVFGVGEVGQRARLALLDRRYGVYFRLFVADDVAA